MVTRTTRSGNAATPAAEEPEPTTTAGGRSLPKRAARPSASLSESHQQLSALDRLGVLPSAAAIKEEVQEQDAAMDVSTAASALSSSRPTRGRPPAAVTAAQAPQPAAAGGKRKREASGAEDGDGDGDATVATAGSGSGSAARNSRASGAAAAAVASVVKAEDELSTSAASGGSKPAAKAGYKGGGTYGGGNYTSDPPKRLELLGGDKNSRGTTLESVIRIRPPDVRMKAFDWSTNKNSKVKYFVLALVSAKGGRIAPETYRALPVQYRIAALEEKKGPGSRGGMVTVEEELYQGSGTPTAGGLYYFHVPSFRIPGRYRLSFAAAPEPGTASAPEHGKLEGVSRVVTVVTQDQEVPLAPAAAAGAGAAREKAGVKWKKGGYGGGGKLVRVGSEGAAVAAEAEAGGGGAGAIAVVDEAAEAAAAAAIVFVERAVKGRAFELTVPGELRRLLCEDWYLVTRRRRLVPLPRKPCVLDILRAFEKQQQMQQQEGSGSGSGLSATGHKLLALFDGALGNLLLYRFERDQYVRALLPALEQHGKGGGKKGRGGSHAPTQQQQLQRRGPGRPPLHKGKGKGKAPAEEEDAAIMASKRAPHAVYGAEHLLRLLVSAPRFLAADGRADDEEDGVIGGVQAYLLALLEHVAGRRAALFAAHAEAPAEYAPDVPRAHHRA